MRLAGMGEESHGWETPRLVLLWPQCCCWRRGRWRRPLRIPRRRCLVCKVGVAALDTSDLVIFARLERVVRGGDAATMAYETWGGGIRRLRIGLLHRRRVGLDCNACVLASLIMCSGSWHVAYLHVAMHTRKRNRG